MKKRRLIIPVHIARYELVDDSDGAGKYRGGLGLQTGLPALITRFRSLSSRTETNGALGGCSAETPGEIARYTLNPDGEATKTRLKSHRPTEAGGIWCGCSPVGVVGYGPAVERDPQLVLRDVHEGKVSLHRAREIYRVAIDTGHLDRGRDGNREGYGHGV